MKHSIEISRKSVGVQKNVKLVSTVCDALPVFAFFWNGVRSLFEIWRHLLILLKESHHLRDANRMSKEILTYKTFKNAYQYDFMSISENGLLGTQLAAVVCAVFNVYMHCFTGEQGRQGSRGASHVRSFQRLRLPAGRHQRVQRRSMHLHCITPWPSSQCPVHDWDALNSRRLRGGACV